MDPFGMLMLSGPEAVLDGGVVVDGATVAVVVEVVVAVVDVAAFEDASFEDPAQAPAISVIAPSRHAMDAIEDHLSFMDPR